MLFKVIPSALKGHFVHEVWLSAPPQSLAAAVPKMTPGNLRQSQDAALLSTFNFVIVSISGPRVQPSSVGQLVALLGLIISPRILCFRGNSWECLQLQLYNTDGVDIFLQTNVQYVWKGFLE